MVLTTMMKTVQMMTKAILLLNIVKSTTTTATAKVTATATATDQLEDTGIADDTGSISDTTITTTFPPNHTDRIVEWIRSSGGYVNDKISIRHMDLSDDTSPFGVYATSNIDKDEQLLHVPLSCYIRIDERDKLTTDITDGNDEEDNNESSNSDNESEENQKENEGFEPYYDNLCRLSRRIRDEMNLGSSSQYAPYVAYLETQRIGQIPVMWSDEGKDALQTLIPPGFDTVDWMYRHFKFDNDNGNYDDSNSSNNKKNDRNDCVIPQHGIMGLWSLEIAKQRGYDTTLIPVWDMFNHDNSWRRLNTVNNPMYEASTNGIVVRSSRDIPEGEELYATYDKCTDCMDTESYWGSTEILRDFGFVEQYPRRWVYPDREIWFELYLKKDSEEDEDDDGGEGDEIDENDVHVYLGEPGDEYEPSTSDIIFLKEELARVRVALRRLMGGTKISKEDVPANEWDITIRYGEAYVKDLSLALDWFSLDSVSDISAVSHNSEL